MRYLLDTNVLLRLFDARLNSLPAGIRSAVTDSGGELYASVASLWEIAIKTLLRKLVLAHGLAKLPDVVDALGIGLLVIDHRHVLTEARPDPLTRDPFDRLLLAQCAVEGLRLVTLDRALATHPLALRAA